MDYSKQCWFCRKVTMVDKGNYYQCSECEASWNEQPVLGPFIDIEVDKGIGAGETKYRPVRRRGRTIARKR